MLRRFFKKHLRIFVLIASIFISVLIFLFRDKLLGLGGYGLFGLFLISLFGASTILIPIPVFLAAFAAGAVFNPFIVAVVVSLGAAIGELTGYMAGYGAEDILEKDLKLKRVRKWMDRYELWVLFVLAAIPNPFFDLAGIVAGATEVPIRRYLLVVWLGKLIKFGVIAFLGSRSIVFLDKFI